MAESRKMRREQQDVVASLRRLCALAATGSFWQSLRSQLQSIRETRASSRRIHCRLVPFASGFSHVGANRLYHFITERSRQRQAVASTTAFLTLASLCEIELVKIGWLDVGRYHFPVLLNMPRSESGVSPED
jgi:hypothetical protein